jgi:hypothetical protein
MESSTQKIVEPLNDKDLTQKIQEIKEILKDSNLQDLQHYYNFQFNMIEFKEFDMIEFKELNDSHHGNLQEDDSNFELEMLEFKDLNDSKYMITQYSPLSIIEIKTKDIYNVPFFHDTIMEISLNKIIIDYKYMNISEKNAFNIGKYLLNVINQLDQTKSTFYYEECTIDQLNAIKELLVILKETEQTKRDAARKMYMED